LKDATKFLRSLNIASYSSVQITVFCSVLKFPAWGSIDVFISKMMPLNTHYNDMGTKEFGGRTDKIRAYQMAEGNAESLKCNQKTCMSP
jgi:hypothetical protein